MRLWNAVVRVLRRMFDDGGPVWEGATPGWSPKGETGEALVVEKAVVQQGLNPFDEADREYALLVLKNPGIVEVIAEHHLNPLDRGDREHALDLLALRHYVGTRVSIWSASLAARLDEFAGEGWRNEAPVLEVPDFQMLHALVDDTAAWSPEHQKELNELLADVSGQFVLV